MHDGFIGLLRFKGAQFTQLDPHSPASLDGQGRQPRQIRALFARQLDQDGQFILLGRHMQRPGRHAAQGHLQGLHQVRRGDPVAGRLVAIHPEEKLILGRLDGIIHIHHPGFLAHPGAHEFSRGNQLIIRLVRAAIDLGYQRGQHGGPGRQFNQFEAGAGPFSQGRYLIPDPKHQCMTIHFAFLAGQQADAHIRHIGPLPQIIMPDQPIEIHGRCRPDRRGEVRHFRDRPEQRLDLPHHCIRPLQRGRLRQIHHNLELILVIEGQHLEWHQAGQGQDKGTGKQKGRNPRQHPGLRAGLHERQHHFRIHPVRQGLPHITRIMFMPFHLEQFIGQPGSDGHRHNQRTQHGERHIQGHRPHIGAHHAGDKKHRQERHNHSQCRQDDGRHHLVHGHGDCLQPRELAHGQMPVDVLHPDNRIIHQQTQRQDQGEQRHAVDGIARQVVDHQGQGVGDRHGNHHNQAHAPVHGQGNQSDHGNDGNHQAFEQIGHLLVRGLPRVTGHPELHFIRNDIAPHRFQQLLNITRHPDRIAPLLLRHRNGDGREGGGKRSSEFRSLWSVVFSQQSLCARTETDTRVGHRLLGSVGNLRHVAQIDRPAGMQSHHQIANVLCTGQKWTRFHQHFPIGLLEGARPCLNVGHFEGAGNVHG